MHRVQEPARDITVEVSIITALNALDALQKARTTRDGTEALRENQQMIEELAELAIALNQYAKGKDNG